MATNPIYVETEEEIPELVERLREGVLDTDRAGHQSARSTVATAMAAMPSPRPTNPIPSFVVNFTFTSRADMPAGECVVCW